MSNDPGNEAGVPVTPPDATNPAGADSLLGVLRQAEDDGFTTQLIATDEGRVQCAACDTTSDPAAFDVSHLRRLEGASDVDDMLLVASMSCPACGAKGALVLGYGPNAAENDVAVSRQLDVRDADAAPSDHER
ncbi:MAG: hypothetical protein WBP59_17965 [Ilumatobacteraceae bacterium]